MRKILVIILISLFLVSPVLAFESSEVVNNEAPSAYFYSQEFDKLVLDLTIPSGIDEGEDRLLAITIANTGTARNNNDIGKFKLWKDADEPGFQGLGKDEELGTFIYYASDIIWYLDNLSELVPAEGLRIFVSAEIAKAPTSNRFIQMKASSLDDKDNDGTFDLADLHRV